MTHLTTTRRRMLAAVGTTAFTGALAGCTGDGSSDGSDTGNDSDEDTGEERFDGWFDGVANYEGPVDMTGTDEVRIETGAGPDGLLYEPAAVVVSPGTTVVWEWTGSGGAHDVVEENGAFESELYGDAGETFEHIFDDEGTFRYYCSPHRSVGMKGAVIVE